MEFNSSWLQGLVHVQASVEAVGNLASDANFARFWFARLFPDLKRAVYLDTDVVVLHDISQLWDSVVSSQQLLAVVERDSPTFGDVFGDEVLALYAARFVRGLVCVCVYVCVCVWCTQLSAGAHALYLDAAVHV